MKVPQGYDGVIDFISNNIINATPAFVDFSGASPIRIFSGDVITYTLSSASSTQPPSVR